MKGLLRTTTNRRKQIRRKNPNFPKETQEYNTYQRFIKKDTTLNRRVKTHSNGPNFPPKPTPQPLSTDRQQLPTATKQNRQEINSPTEDGKSVKRTTAALRTPPACVNVLFSTCCAIPDLDFQDALPHIATAIGSKTAGSAKRHSAFYCAYSSAPTERPFEVQLSPCAAPLLCSYSHKSNPVAPSFTRTAHSGTSAMRSRAIRNPPDCNALSPTNLH